MTREDLEHRTVWRAQGKGWRTFAYVWLPFTLAFLIATALVDEVHWGTRVGAVCNVVGSLGLWCWPTPALAPTPAASR